MEQSSMKGLLRVDMPSSWVKDFVSWVTQRGGSISVRTVVSVRMPGLTSGSRQPRKAGPGSPKPAHGRR